MTDYTDIQRVISRLKKHVVPDPIINNDAFDNAFSILYEKYKRNNYYEPETRHPIIFKYLRNNFVFYCKHYPGLVGAIAALGVNEPDYWLPELKSYETNEPINWQNLHLTTIANAEAMFQKAKKEVRDIVSTKDHTKKRINKVLSEIEPLAGSEPYNDIRWIYWMLYCELRVTLQFHKQDPDWDFFFTIGEHPEHWFKLRGEVDVPALKYLHEHSIEEYSNNTVDFKDGLLSAVKKDCVSENSPLSPPEIHEPKSQLYGTKNKNHLILEPSLPVNKKHQNIITWYDDIGNEHIKENVGNDPFDFLYYLAWLYKNDTRKKMKFNSDVLEEVIFKIIPGKSRRDKLHRFETAWATKEGGDQKTKKSSKVNGYFKFDLIRKKGIYYQLNDSLTVRLMPYPEI